MDVSKKGFEKVKKVIRYKYIKSRDTVEITNGTLWRRAWWRKPDNDIIYKQEKDACYQYIFYNGNSIAYISYKPGIVYRNTFYLDEYDNEKAFEIIKNEIILKDKPKNVKIIKHLEDLVD